MIIITESLKKKDDFNLFSTEIFAVKCSANADQKIISSTYRDKNKIKIDDALPLGSIEFSLKIFKEQGINISEKLNSYPTCLLHKPFFNRMIKSYKLNYIKENPEVVCGKFVKSNFLKIIESRVYDSSEDFLHEVTEKMVDKYKNLVFYVSDVVDFVSEYRYYIVNNKIVGFARYDDKNLDITFVPDIKIVELAVKKMKTTKNSPRGYALDFGVLKNGETELVEFNDGWSLGLYKGNIKNSDYYDLLRYRFQEIYEKKSLLVKPLLTLNYES